MMDTTEIAHPSEQSKKKIEFQDATSRENPHNTCAKIFEELINFVNIPLSRLVRCWTDTPFMAFYTVCWRFSIASSKLIRS